MRVWGQTSEWVSGLFSTKKADTVPCGSRHGRFHWSDLSPALLELGNGEGQELALATWISLVYRGPAGGWWVGTRGGAWPGWVLLRLVAECQELEQVEGSKEGRGGGPWCLLPSQGPLGVSFLTQQRLSKPYPPPPRIRNSGRQVAPLTTNVLGRDVLDQDGKWEDPFSLPLSLW